MASIAFREKRGGGEEESSISAPAEKNFE